MAIQIKDSFPALSGGTAAVRLELDIHPDFFLQCLVKESAKNDEEETKEDTEDWHSTFFRVFS